MFPLQMQTKSRTCKKQIEQVVLSANTCLKFQSYLSGAYCRTLNDGEEDLFTPGMQGKLLSDMGKTMARDLSKVQKGDGTAFDPKTVVDNLIVTVREESANSGQPLDPAFIQALEEFKNDPDYTTLVREFEESLSGTKNILTIGKSKN